DFIDNKIPERLGVLKEEKVAYETERYRDEKEKKILRELVKIREKSEQELMEEKNRLKQKLTELERQLKLQRIQLQLQQKIDSLYRLAFEQYDSEQYASATASFREILKIDPNQKIAREYLDGKVPARVAEIEQARKQREAEKEMLRRQQEREEELLSQQQEQKKNLLEARRAREEDMSRLQREQKEEMSRLEQEQKDRLSQTQKEYEEKMLQKQQEAESQLAELTNDKSGLEQTLGELENKLKQQEEQLTLRTKLDALYKLAFEQYDNKHYEEAKATFSEILQVDPGQKMAGDYLGGKIPDRLNEMEQLKQKEQKLSTVLEEQERQIKLKEKQIDDIAREKKEQIQEKEDKIRKITQAREEVEEELTRLKKEKSALKGQVAGLEEQLKQSELEVLLQKKIDSLYKLGFEQYDSGHYDQAKVAFDEILRVDPEQASAKEYLERKIPLAIAQEQTRRERERQLAQKETEVQLIKLQQDRSQLKAALANLETQLNTQEDQILTQKKIHELYRAAFAQYDNGRYSHAKDIFKEIIALDPGQKMAKNYIVEKIPYAIRLSGEGKEKVAVVPELKEPAAGEQKGEKEIQEELRSLEKQLKRQQAQLATQKKIDDLYKRAFEQYDNAEYRQARSTFRQILRIDPEQTIARDYVEEKITAKLREGKKGAQAQKPGRDAIEEELQKIENTRSETEKQLEKLQQDKQKVEEGLSALERQLKSQETKDTAGTESAEKEPTMVEITRETPELEKDPEEYRVKEFDLVSIRVYGEPGLSGDYKVEKDGSIEMPLLKRVQVKGLAVNEIKDKLTSMLAKDYIVNPQVTASITEHHAGKIVVLGQVARPGAYELSKEGPVTLLRAVAMAGGFSNIAATRGVKVIRMEDGQKKTYEVNADHIIDGKTKDIALYPGDMVVVPESLW
ncbi:MAG: polysaccharide biosynthesis/export family protein, partial [Candidatus Omnitrophota bacterium]